ncbi:hypothetical protein A0H81_10189 [Grifola frondosa]|uniref:FAD-binding PCMH-type domain-containing protein n=1 Tax=Grifola frondosa TaxID=5627 RepID=A0A1C7M3Q5_GRIFR|nr:hypothetical protein A0H81_10189 [Grifola frondosa]
MRTNLILPGPSPPFIFMSPRTHISASIPDSQGAHRRSREAVLARARAGLPLDAHDVSAAVRFCIKHRLSPSVKAGGYGIAGWSVAGDVIIDLGLIRDVDIEPPVEVAQGERDWTTLKDMLPLGSKGKGRANVGSIKLAAPPEGAPAIVSSPPVPSNAHASPALTTVSPAASAKRRRRMRLKNQTKAPRRISRTTARWRDTKTAAHQPPPAPLARARRIARHRNAQDAAPGGDGETVFGQVHVLKRRLGPGLRLRLDFGVWIVFFTEHHDGNDAPAGESRARDAQNGGRTRAVRVHVIQRRDVRAADVQQRGAALARVLVSRTAAEHLERAVLHPRSPTEPGCVERIRVDAFIPSHVRRALAPAARCTGYSWGRGTCTARAPHAYVTLGAGMRQKEVDTYTAEHPLEGISGVTGDRQDGVIPYHLPSSAHPVGSSIMLLGGFGFLSRMYGLSIDNLVEVEMVLADGRIVVVSKEADPELWWAVRAQGPRSESLRGNKVRAFPVLSSSLGNIVYSQLVFGSRFHRATAPSLIKHFRDCIKGAPRELCANVGPKEKGMEYLEAISSWDGERCLLNEVNEKSFLNQQDSVAQILRGKTGASVVHALSLIGSLPDEVINKTVIQFANTPIGCSAIGDFEDNCLPKEQREATWTVAALHQCGEMGIDDPRCITSAERSTIGAVALGGPYPTFLGRHEPPARTMACYGKNWSRLSGLKHKYDPQCLFKNNFWPLDKDGQPIELLDNEPPSP